MLDLFGSPAILRGGWAYYNDVDPFCVEWARGLIAAGRITTGEVDERSIRDVQPDDLRGFRRCHFFAGIGGWDLALQLAGWPDDQEVWTGSCPCPPFSFWDNVEWLACRDGKLRPTQPGLQPLAHGIPGRVGLLRGYGNAIVPQVAAEFVRAYLEIGT